MAILAFQKPEKVIMIQSTETCGKFELHPLEPRYGITVGNALRRILLASLEGFAITSIRIEGVKHEFSTIPGVLEDVTNIILSLKEVRFCRVVKDEETEKISILVSGKEKNTFTAGDFSKSLSSFKVLNPELVICHLDESASFNLEITIKKGRGYVPADENREKDDLIDTIAIDSIFTPIRNVKYSVENFRVEQKTDYENLILEITTDGSISPKDALQEAAKILIYHFGLFAEEKTLVFEAKKPQEEEICIDDDDIRVRQLLKTKLSEMNLSVRAINCLNSAQLETLGELVQMERNDLLKFRNFGRKSLTELDELLDSLHLSFGMDISKYNLDNQKE